MNLQAIINKKIIRAPFDGRAGIRAVELGQVVSPGTPIVSLQTVSPIYAEFQLPQQALAVVKLGQKVTLKVDVFPDSSWEGTVTTINPEVDPGTRNVRMRATVENHGRPAEPGHVRQRRGRGGQGREGPGGPGDQRDLRPLRRLGVPDRGEEGRSAGPGRGRQGATPAPKAAAAKAPMASPSSSRASSSFASASAAVTSWRCSTG